MVAGKNNNEGSPLARGGKPLPFHFPRTFP
jgi:hypothetical protein